MAHAFCKPEGNVSEILLIHTSSANEKNPLHDQTTLAGIITFQVPGFVYEILFNSPSCGSEGNR